jgi:nicotinamide mononucleotide adenylyltransferase
MMTGIFSGRFDPVHVGHILTAMKLIGGGHCDKLLIVVLDYDGRESTTAEESKATFDLIFSKTDLPIKVVINSVHFGNINEIQYLTLLSQNGIREMDAIYFSGNESVIGHIKSLGMIRYKFVPRSGKWSGTSIRNGDN